MKKKTKTEKEPTWDEIGKAIGMKMEKCKGEECFHWKMKESAKSHGCGGALYGLGFIGALIYYLTTATSITAGVIGFFKAIFWPAFLIYSLMKSLGM